MRGYSFCPGESMCRSINAALKLIMAFIIGVFFLLSAPFRLDAAVFNCSSGNVGCLINAINQSNATSGENTINLASGTYTLETVNNTNDGPTGLPSITGNMTIIGVGMDATTIQRDSSASSFFRIFDVSTSGNLTLEGLTVTGGKEFVGSGWQNGGGIYSSGALIVQNSRISQNTAGDFTQSGNGVGFGGGIYSSGQVTIKDSIVSGNQAFGGYYQENAWNSGGGGLSVDGSLIVVNSTFTGNVADDGGGIYNGGTEWEIYNGGTAVISDSSFVGNRGNDGGGAIQQNGPTMTITDSTFYGNGGGVGGTIYNWVGALSITNCTIYGNSAWTYDGGIDNEQSGSVQLQNTILAGNSESDCSGSLVSLGNNLIGSPSNCTITLLSTDLTGDPKLGVLTYSELAGIEYLPLMSGSPAIDAANNNVCQNFATDQIGNPRIVDGNGDGTAICDIGAIEFIPYSAAFAVNAGGGQYTDTSGIVFQADTDYSGGHFASTTATITGTSDGTLYQSERFGNISYNIPLADGNYTVTLKFAEIYWNAAGQRIFNVSMQGTQVISNLDIFAQVGKDAAYDVTIPVSVTNGKLNITFTSVVDNAKVSAIEVTQVATPCTASAPTVSIKPASQNVTSGGYDTYAISIKNNDSGTSCASTTFNLAVSDTNSTNFYTSTANPASVALAPGTSGTSTLTVTAKSAQTSGTDSTTVTATASGHANGVSNAATTSISIPPSCTVSAPTVSITPASQTVASGASDTYTISVTNNDSGTACTSTTFNLLASDTNSTNFNTSTASPGSVTLSPGGSGTSTLTVTAKAAQTSGTDSTTVTASASGHANGVSNAVTTTIGTSPVTVFAVNSGGGQYTNPSSGIVYKADTDYSGGSAASTTAVITGTSDPTLYQTERYGNFSYNIPLANGNYSVTLKFAEIYWTAAGKRVFNVSMQGTQVLSNLDIFAQAGKDAAYDVTIPVSVTNGTLNIAFTTIIDNAKVSAILVTSGNALSPDTTPPTVPAGVKATAASSSQINISWTASTDPVVAGQVTSGVAGYKIYRNGTQVGTSTTTNYADTGLTASTTYSYTISAYDVAGNNSAQSTAATATTLSSSSSGTVVFADNAGGGQYTDHFSTVYQADANYSGGAAASTTAAITGTVDPTLYQTERYGNFSYNIPLANGNYNVTLKFAEIYWSASGKRVFDVSMQGTQVVSNLDIFAQVGKDAAYDVTIPVSVTNGTLNITFSTVIDNAKVSAIEVATQ